MSFELNSPETASGKVGGFPVPAAPLSCGGTGVGRVNENNPLDVGSIDVTAGETATISPVAPPSQARSQLATGAYPGARRLSLPLADHTFPGFRTSNRATTRALRGRDQLGAAQAEGTKSAQALEAVAEAEPVNAGSAPDAPSFQIVGGKPNPAGNSAAAPINGFLPRGSARFVTCSSKQQPTQHLCDCSSEQDEIFLVGPVLLGRHPSFPTPSFNPSLLHNSNAPCVSQTHSASDGGRSDGTVVRRTRNLVQQYGG